MADMRIVWDERGHASVRTVAELEKAAFLRDAERRWRGSLSAPRTALWQWEV